MWVQIEPAFSGKHDNSILGVANKDYPAAAIANSVMAQMIERGATAAAESSASAEAVASVDEHGSVSITGSGEGAVTAWFSSQIVIAGITVQRIVAMATV